jgi:hypothetical protein
VIKIGADLILGSVLIHSGSREQILKDTEEVLKQINENINLNEWKEYLQERGIEQDTPEEQKQYIINLINDFLNALDFDRGVMYFNYGRYYLFVSGGMSWGESPTEASDTFYYISEFIPEKYAKQIGIVYEIDPVQMILDVNDLPKDLEDKLIEFKIAKEV